MSAVCAAIAITGAAGARPPAGDREVRAGAAPDRARKRYAPAPRRAMIPSAIDQRRARLMIS